jgi:hypothetical protein
VDSKTSLDAGQGMVVDVFGLPDKEKTHCQPVLDGVLAARPARLTTTPDHNDSRQRPSENDQADHRSPAQRQIATT